MSKHQKRYFESNKELWDKRSAIHKNSDFYDLKGFKQGKCVLNELELSELGDVKGKSMLHLQCHFGLDSMSWARRGVNVTGIDFSPEAINIAKEINSELILDATFLCSNVYDLKENLNQKFDIIFTSYGVVGWLPDLDRWADIISHFLKPGGVFYMAEFHPVVWMFDDDFTKIEYSYFKNGVIEVDADGTYTDFNANINHKEYSWNHSLAEVINALTSHGLHIEFLNEVNYSPYNCFKNTIENQDGNFYIKGYEGMMPMVYSIKAQKD